MRNGKPFTAARPLVLTAALAALGCAGPGGPTFSVTFPADRSAEPLDGRLVLMLSQDDAAEPRFQIVDGPDSQLAFGVDVDGWAPGEPVTVDGAAFGYPIRSLNDVPRRGVPGAGAPEPLPDLRAR